MSFPIEQGLFKYEITDHYAILGVPLNADSRQVRQRYLKIAYILHPDTFRGQSAKEKRLATKILSKLVNPAYEHLSKDRSRNEYQLVLSQMGQNLSKELSSITIVTEEAQKLLHTSENKELTYHRLLLPLVAKEYENLETVFQMMARISELNLIYLMIREGEEVEKKAKAVVQVNPKPKAKPQAKPKSKPPVSKKPENSKKQEEEKIKKQAEKSAIATSLKRAQEYIDRKNLSQAIIELRATLKEDPNNSTCHGLLGLAYLKGNQLTMAKVHISKAHTVNPQDPIVIQAKQELDKVSPESEKSKSSDKPKGGGLFGLFGKKK